MSHKRRVILGIDPGTTQMGYGIVTVKGKELIMVEYGVIHLKKYLNHAEKLKKIYDKISYLVKTYSPTEAAIEAPFFGTNVQSMLKLGRAQGVAMAAVMGGNIPITEYVPRKVKQAVTGNGSATKEQVAGMLSKLMKLPNEEIALDATDALGVAVCHYFQDGRLSTTTKGGWKGFLKNNPNRKL